MQKVLFRLRQSPIIKRILSLFLLLPILCSLSITAFGAPAVAVPVTAEVVAELLVALGLMAGNATDGYIWKANDNPYVTSIFESQVSAITGDIPVSSETLSPLLGTVIPEGVYSQSEDGSFFVAGKPVTSSDIFLNAKSLIGVTYGLPVNVYAISDYSARTEGQYSGWYSPLGVSDVNNGNCFIPIYGRDGAILFSKFALAVYPSQMRLFDFSGKMLQSGVASGGKGLPNYISAGSGTTSPFVFGVESPSINGNYRYGTSAWQGALLFDVLGQSVKKTEVWSSLDYATFAVTKGIPVDTILADDDKLEGAVVKVEINNFNPVPPEGGGNNQPDKTVVVPVPPVWEIWKSIADLITEVDTGSDTNNGTSLGGYINNNYNYQSVDVDVNVPDNFDVGISGGLDINANVNIHESLPSVSSGDGSGFFDAGAVDVLAGLTTDNPVFGVTKGLFSALDPALVGIFSVSVSLLLLLGLWKLIKG